MYVVVFLRRWQKRYKMPSEYTPETPRFRQPVDGTIRVALKYCKFNVTRCVSEIRTPICGDVSEVLVFANMFGTVGK